MEVVVDNLAATTDVSITPNSDTFHRIDSASTHADTIIYHNPSAIFGHDNTFLRKTYHIAERMGKDVYSFTPPYIVKNYLRALQSAYHAEAPKPYLLAVFHTL